MKQRNLIFNVIGFTIGAFGALIGVGQALHRYHAWISLYTCAISALVGVGSLTNLANRSLGRLPTIAAIIGYFISVWLIPLGIWGVVLLMLEPKRRHRRRPPI